MIERTPVPPGPSCALVETIDICKPVDGATEGSLIVEPSRIRTSVADPLVVRCPSMTTG